MLVVFVRTSEKVVVVVLSTMRWLWCLFTSDSVVPGVLCTTDNAAADDDTNIPHPTAASVHGSTWP